MWKQIEQVRYWHETFRVPIVKEPKMPSQQRIILRYRLLIEEANELKDATDIEEAADAIGDILYVLLGTAHEYGLASRLPAIFDEIQRSNMSKLDKDGNPIFRPDGKIMKSDLFSKPDLKPILESKDY